MTQADGAAPWLGGCETDAALSAQELWQQKREFWVSTVRPLTESLSAICPSVLVLAAEVEIIVTEPESFSPSSGTRI